MSQKIIYIITIFQFLSLTLGFSTEDKKAPNIIYILADDLGYGDLGCYGSELNDTPNIDRLAKNGLKCTDFHAATWCLPSRVALMTGCEAHRPGMGVVGGKDKLKQAIYLPQLMKQKNYATALIGKWHLGLDKGLHPNDRGFDYFYGTKGSNDWDGPGTNQDAFDNTPENGWKTPLYIGKEKKGILPQSLMTKRYTEESIQFIKKNKKNPFFLYLSHNMPHVPIFASDNFKGKSRNGVYGDVLMELDWSVGQIIETLKEAKLDKNTLIVFTSDNGPWSMFGAQHAGVSGSLRGEKGTCWEGGDRVPAIFSFPGKIKPGVSDEFISNLDMYATFASLIGLKIPEAHAIDSLNMSDVIFRQATSKRQRQVILHHGTEAYRKGNYKLHFSSKSRLRDPITGKKEVHTKHNPPLLFNLKRDREERNNIASQHPELLSELLLDHKKSMKSFGAWQPVH